MKKFAKILAVAVSAAMLMVSSAFAGVAEINYSNVPYDFADQIGAEKSELHLVPEEADIQIKAADENFATGVILTASAEEGNTEDYYLNAYVAGDAVVLTPVEGAEIVSATSTAVTEMELADGVVKFIPAPIMAAEPADEVVTVTMADGTVYNVHTVNQYLPIMSITNMNVDPANAGIYNFAIDHFLLRVNTEGELVYYRNILSAGENMVENFAVQATPEGEFPTYFAELNPEYRNANGGYSSGMYVVMDDKYCELEYVTLLPNTEENHVHGEGYLDQHEFNVLGFRHYILLSYTPELVANLPEGVEGLDGGNTAWVWPGVFQEVKDGEVVAEINTSDYPMLYESAVEKLDYANSTDQGVVVTVGQNEVPSWADGLMDYVHVNSFDYTLTPEGTVDKLLVSMRDQCAVYQFDMASGEIEWILGGKASTLTGYEDFTTTRTDEAGNEFQALSYGQHYARYTNKNEAGTIEGPVEISVFDNQTGMGPFIRAVPVPTLTRTFKATIDAEAGTAEVFDVIEGTHMDELTDKYHNASHCGSVDYFNDNSVVIGWGLHGVIDNIGPFAPEGTISDIGFDDLRQGSRPVFTEYDKANDAVTFELTVERNPLVQSHEGLFSYRTYKSVK